MAEERSDPRDKNRETDNPDDMGSYQEGIVEI
jgi:hypothetical protein